MVLIEDLVSKSLMLDIVTMTFIGRNDSHLLITIRNNIKTATSGEGTTCT